MGTYDEGMVMDGARDAMSGEDSSSQWETVRRVSTRAVGVVLLPLVLAGCGGGIAVTEESVMDEAEERYLVDINETRFWEATVYEDEDTGRYGVIDGEVMEPLISGEIPRYDEVRAGYLDDDDRMEVVAFNTKTDASGETVDKGYRVIEAVSTGGWKDTRKAGKPGYSLDELRELPRLEAADERLDGVRVRVDRLREK